MSSETQNPRTDLPTDPGFWALATGKMVVKRAARIALVVGTILAIINHGDRMMTNSFDFLAVLKILLTYCVPYSVSTYSSVLAIRENSITQRVET